MVKFEISSETPERACRKCGASKPLDPVYFDRDTRCGGGFRWDCVECRRTAWHAWAESPEGQAKVQQRYALQRDARRRDPKQAKRDRREKYETYRDSEAAQFATWQSKPDVRARRSAEQSIRGAVLMALGDGWCSPICQRHGFSLVRRTVRKNLSGYDSARFAARRLDRPIEAGEYVVAEYYVADGRWICLPPSLGAGSPALYAAEDAWILRWLQGRAQRGETTGLPRPESLSLMLDRVETQATRETTAAVHRVVRHLEEVFTR